MHTGLINNQIDVVILYTVILN